jgi:hypothetical protein
MSHFDSARPYQLCWLRSQRYTLIDKKCPLQRSLNKSPAEIKATNYLPVTPATPVPGGVEEVLWLSA